MYGPSGIADLLLVFVAMIGVGGVLLLMALAQSDAVIGTGSNAIAKVRELLAARAFERVEELCKHASGTCLAPVGAGLRAGAAAGSHDVAAIDAAARAAFEAEATKVQARGRRVLGRFMWGTILLVAPIALLEGNHDPALPWSVGAVTILVVIWVCTRRRRVLDARLASVRQELVPAIAPALADAFAAARVPERA